MKVYVMSPANAWHITYYAWLLLYIIRQKLSLIMKHLFGAMSPWCPETQYNDIHVEVNDKMIDTLLYSCHLIKSNFAFSI